LLDSCAYIEMADGDSRVADAVSATAKAYFSVVALGELLVGFPPGDRGDRERATLDHFIALNGVRILPVRQETATAYASLFNHVKQRGRMIPQNDLWIAATALEYDLVILTADGHFTELPVECLLLD
jgi:tRNA(fMet)-specific endonuclease VapC